MELKDLADLLVAATDKIEFLWNFYVVMLIALIGWLVSTKRPLSRSLKLLITIGYLIFVSMNLLGLFGSYTLAEALRTDAVAMLKAEATLQHTLEALQDLSYAEQRAAAVWIHAILGLAVLLVVWLGRFGQPDDEPIRSLA